jgi:hypothetical protein
VSSTMNNPKHLKRELPPEQRPIPIHITFRASVDGERVTYEDQEILIYLTPMQIAQLVFSVIPDWLKDSRSPIPMSPDKEPQEAKGEQQLLETGRIAMKGFVSASGMILSMGRDLYGPDFQLVARMDTLPIVSRWMSWFVASRVAQAPLEILVENGYIADIRQGEYVSVPGSDTETPCDNC